MAVPVRVLSTDRFSWTRSAGPPRKNPGPWAEASRALSYRAVTGPYYVDNVDIRGPAGPCRAPKSRRAPGILPPLPPPSRRACRSGETLTRPACTSDPLTSLVSTKLHIFDIFSAGAIVTGNEFHDFMIRIRNHSF